MSEVKAKNHEIFLLLYKTKARQDILACFALTLVLIVFRFKALLNFSSSYIGGFEGDVGLYIWLLKSNARDLFRLPWFNTSAFYPYTQSLAWSDNFILPSLVYALFAKAGISSVCSYNLLICLVNFLNGYVTYRLCYQLCGNFKSALCSGCLFLGLSYFSSNLGHPQLQFAFCIPWGLIYFFKFVAEPKLFSAVYLSVIVTLSFLCAVYYAIFLSLALLICFFTFLLLHPKYLKRGDFLKLILGSSLGLLPLLFFIGPYLNVRSTFGARHIYEAYYFSASALSYLSASPFHALYHSLSSLSHSEAYLFPGFILIVVTYFGFSRLTEAKTLKIFKIYFLMVFLTAIISSELSSVLQLSWAKYLCAVSLWAALLTFAVLIWKMGALEKKLKITFFTNRAILAVFVALALSAFVLSMGPLGNPEKNQLAIGPYVLFYYLFPGFNSIRAISRIGILVQFSLVVVFALSFSYLLGKRKIKTNYLLGVTLLILVENFNASYPLQPEIGAPGIFQTLSEKEPGVAIVLPLTSEQSSPTVKNWGDFARFNTNYMNWAFATNMQLVNGYSGQRTKLMEEYPRRIQGFPDQISLKALSRISNLKYIAFISTNVKNFDAQAFKQKILANSSNLQLLNEDNQGNFLFEYQTEIQIDDENYLLVPSYPTNVLELELMPLYQLQEPELEFSAYLRDHYPNIPIYSSKIRANGQRHLVQIPIPETPERVRPLKFTFSVNPRNDVYIVGSRVSATSIIK